MTGGQQLPTSNIGTDYAGFARAAGFRSVWKYDDIDPWRENAPEMLSAPGPRFVWVGVMHEPGDYSAPPARTMEDQIRRVKAGLK